MVVCYDCLYCEQYFLILKVNMLERFTGSRKRALVVLDNKLLYILCG